MTEDQIEGQRSIEDFVWSFCCRPSYKGFPARRRHTIETEKVRSDESEDSGKGGRSWTPSFLHMVANTHASTQDLRARDVLADV